MMIEIDYRELLKKYMAHIVEQEGVDYLGHDSERQGYRWGHGEVMFTTQEMDVLRDIACSAWDWR